MLTLYYAPGACSLSVHIVLEWIGKPYEAVKVDPSAPNYRTINPAGAVPALRLESGTVLTQCETVLNYLGRTNPESDLLDTRSDESRAELERWGNFLTGDLHPAFFPIFMPHRYTTATDAGALKAVRDAAINLTASKMALLETHLDGQEWMVGGKRTILDAYSVPMVNWAAAKLPGGLDNYPAVAVHHRRMLADPAVERVSAIENTAA